MKENENAELDKIVEKRKSRASCKKNNKIKIFSTKISALKDRNRREARSARSGKRSRGNNEFNRREALFRRQPSSPRRASKQAPSRKESRAVYSSFPCCDDCVCAFDALIEMIDPRCFLNLSA